MLHSILCHCFPTSHNHHSCKLRSKTFYKSASPLFSNFLKIQNHFKYGGYFIFLILYKTEKNNTEMPQYCLYDVQMYNFFLFLHSLWWQRKGLRWNSKDQICADGLFFFFSWISYECQIKSKGLKFLWNLKHTPLNSQYIGPSGLHSTLYWTDRKKLIHFRLKLQKSRSRNFQRNSTLKTRKEFNIIYYCYRYNGRLSHNVILLADLLLAEYDVRNIHAHQSICRKMSRRKIPLRTCELLSNSPSSVLHPPLHIKQSTKLNESTNIQQKAKWSNLLEKLPNIYHTLAHKRKKTMETPQ